MERPPTCVKVSVSCVCQCLLVVALYTDNLHCMCTCCSCSDEVGGEAPSLQEDLGWSSAAGSAADPAVPEGSGLITCFVCILLLLLQ
jgi:hypothetical protein